MSIDVMSSTPVPMGRTCGATAEHKPAHQSQELGKEDMDAIFKAIGEAWVKLQGTQAQMAGMGGGMCGGMGGMGGMGMGMGGLGGLGGGMGMGMGGLGGLGGMGMGGLGGLGMGGFGGGMGGLGMPGGGFDMLQAVQASAEQTGAQMAEEQGGGCGGGGGGVPAAAQSVGGPPEVVAAQKPPEPVAANAPVADAPVAPQGKVEGGKVEGGKVEGGKTEGGKAPEGMPAEQWEAAKEAGKATGMDPYILAAQAKQETQFGKDTSGPSGGDGVWQAEPTTREAYAGKFQEKFGHAYDHHDVKDQAKMGALIVQDKNGEDMRTKLMKYNGGDNYAPGATDSYGRTIQADQYADKVLSMAAEMKKAGSA